MQDDAVASLPDRAKVVWVASGGDLGSGRHVIGPEVAGQSTDGQRQDDRPPQVQGGDRDPGQDEQGAAKPAVVERGSPHGVDYRGEDLLGARNEAAPRGHRLELVTG